MSDTTFDQARMDLALRALHQIDALLPLAQLQADEGTCEPDVMLGLLGRIFEMNHAAMVLLDPSGCNADLFESTREAVFGRREMNHG